MTHKLDISLKFEKVDLVDKAELSKVKSALNPNDEIGIWSLTAARINARKPRCILDCDERAIPNEINVLGQAVHMKKGCYPGQETVAKVNNLGKPPRKLVLLHLDGSNVDLPKHGDQVFDGEKEVGFVGTVIRHYELGPIALAVINRRTPIENTLICDGISATQELIKRN